MLDAGPELGACRTHSRADVLICFAGTRPNTQHGVIADRVTGLGHPVNERNVRPGPNVRDPITIVTTYPHSRTVIPWHGTIRARSDDELKH